MERLKKFKGEGIRMKGKGRRNNCRNPEASYVLFGSHPDLLRLPVRVPYIILK